MAQTKIAVLDCMIAELYREYYGEGDRPLVVPSEDGLRGIRTRLSQGREELTDPQIGEFWSSHFTELMDALCYEMDEDGRRPFRIIDRMTSALRSARGSVRDRAGIPERLAIKFEPAWDVLKEVLSLVKDCSKKDAGFVSSSAALLIEELRAVRRGLPCCFPERQAQSIEELLSKILEACETVDDNASISLPFAETIKRSFAWDLDDVLSWYEDDLDLCLTEFADIALRIDPSRTPLEILQQDLGPLSSPEEMFRFAKESVLTARENSLGHITLPPGERMPIRPLSAAFKVTCPWGVYNSEEMTSDNLVGWLELNDENYRAVTKGWIEMMAVHEGYPGHHAHFVKTKSRNMLPDSFKTGTTAADYLIEGIAHRSERLFQHIFPEPSYPLFVAYRRLHCALRIKAEIDLHLQMRPFQETVHDYMEIMGFDRASAEIQTQAHFVQPGRAFSYYTGMKILDSCRLESGLDPKPYTELIFSHGNVSLGTMLSLSRMGEESLHKVLMLERP